ncbi:MAG TPA: hypothetical protein VK425_02645, partial [Acidimicrobiales bacterium]|nr:hypothetical protein [Acidimicrobiales bacterium]
NVPVAILGLVAVASLVPESRAGLRPGFDVPGVLSSSAGLAVLTYGFIQAGQHGWASGGAVAPIVVGMGILLGFLAWQRALWRRPEGQPLIDVSLFRSGAFTWGSVLFAVLTMALVGLLFTLPQYFQAVMGTDAEGSGIRLLPVVGGLLMGLVPAPLIAKRLGAKLTTATGFGILAADLALGATTSVRSGEAFSALCLWGAGVGAGLTMATVASGALAEMSEERAGVGSAVLQALKNTGAPLGSAVLGSVLTSGYRTNLHLGGLPAGLAEEARQGVFQGVSVARGVGAPALLASVRSAFVHGMDATFLAALGFALAGAMIALALLPNVRAVRQPRTGRRREHVVA